MRDSWGKVKIGAVCTTFAGGTPSRNNPSFYNGDIPWISSGEVNQATITKTAEYITESALKLSSAKWIPENAVLMAMYGATAGQVSKLKIRATSNQAVLALIPRKDDNDFIYHQLKLRKEKILFLAQGSGQPNLSKNLIDSTLIPLPPLPHQRKIAKILNTVDAVLEKTEAAIAKYKAVKQGMMQDLFTRGIDPQTGKLRPTQKDAPELYKKTELGWIPKEWEVKRIMNVAKINGRVGWKGYTVEDLRDEGPLTIGAGQIDKNNKLTLENSVHLSGEKFRESPEIMVKKGDILVVQRGTIGKYVLIEKEIGEATINPSMILLNNLKCNPHFLYYSLGTNFIFKQIENSTSQTGVPMISQHQVKNFQIVYPSVPEELSQITERIFQIDQLIENEQTNLFKHQSLKKGLMQDLLTGKVEVEV